MNSDLITCFKAATETLNFTVAAQNVHISQPSFSRNIAALEEELGFKLFLRSKQNGVRLTPAGASFYNGLFDIEKSYNELLEKSRQISRGEEGKLVVGVLNGTVMDSQTFNFIKHFQQKYPQVEVSLRSCTMMDLERSLHMGTTDICFALSAFIYDKEDILFEKVFTIPNYMVVPRSSGLEPGKEYELKDLKDIPFLLSEDLSKSNESFIAACRRAGFEPIIKYAPDSETMMLWGEIGEGATVVTLEHYIKNSDHVCVIKIKEMRSTDYSLCWSKNNYNPSIALFYSLVGDVFKS
ncbi:MAG: LysR family transcriptional regulator [Lachnospiraceae bacterium]|nr:LysR family transcriptional regulator [Lachnospiraceae bacterium]